MSNVHEAENKICNGNPKSSCFVSLLVNWTKFAHRLRWCLPIRIVRSENINKTTNNNRAAFE